MARILDVPVLLTEHYPQGLGPTVPELGAQGVRTMSKTSFSMVPPLQQELDKLPQLKSVLLCGIETQVCILVRLLVLRDTYLIFLTSLLAFLLSWGPSLDLRLPHLLFQSPHLA